MALGLKPMRLKNLALAFVAASVVAGLSGCGSTAPESTAPASLPVPPVTFKANVDAGVPVTQSTDVSRVASLSRLASGYGLRANPASAFNLRASERTYDSEMEYLRLASTFGEFEPLFEDPATVVAPVPVIQPQPYRRLSGVVVADSVVALIEMEDGQSYVIRPGQRVGTTEWTVVSIDQQGAVLRRGGNVLPREITVRLEVAPPGLQRPGTGGPGGFPGGPGGPPGFPGGPGGFPGGPGGPPGGFPGRGGGQGGDDF